LAGLLLLRVGIDNLFPLLSRFGGWWSGLSLGHGGALAAGVLVDARVLHLLAWFDWWWFF
jgi:hypothetical protein